MSEFVYYVKCHNVVLAGFDNMINAELFLVTLKNKVKKELIHAWRTDYNKKTGLNFQEFLFSDDDYKACSDIEAKVDSAYTIEFNPDELEDIPFA